MKHTDTSTQQQSADRDSASTPSGLSLRQGLWVAAALDPNFGLYLAVAHEMPSMIPLMLKNGANINTTFPHTDNVCTPLNLAVIKNNTAIAEALLIAGANADAYCTPTPLLFAISHGYLKMANLLIHHGAKKDLRDTDGYTALMLATLLGHTETAQTLIAAGANVDLRETDGRTALTLATLLGHTETVQVLIDAGAKIDSQGMHGHTALMLAALHGHTEAVQALIAAEAKLDLQCTDGFSALILAAFKGHTETVQVLIGAGADIDLRDTDGMTALMWAAYKGYTEMAKALITAGADINCKDTHGYTALLVAAGKGHNEIEQALIAVGSGPENASITRRDAPLSAGCQGNSNVAATKIQRFFRQVKTPQISSSSIDDTAVQCP